MPLATLAPSHQTSQPLPRSTAAVSACSPNRSSSFSRSLSSSIPLSATALHHTTPPKYVQDNLFLETELPFEAYCNTSPRKELPCPIPLLIARPSRKPSSIALAN